MFGSRCRLFENKKNHSHVIDIYVIALVGEAAPQSSTVEAIYRGYITYIIYNYNVYYISTSLSIIDYKSPKFHKLHATSVLFLFYLFLFSEHVNLQEYRVYII